MSNEFSIKIYEIENRLEDIYKFNKDNNDTIANLFLIEKKRSNTYIKIFDNYIEKANYDLYIIKITLFVISICNCWLIFDFILRFDN